MRRLYLKIMGLNCSSVYVCSFSLDGSRKLEFKLSPNQVAFLRMWKDRHRCKNNDANSQNWYRVVFILDSDIEMCYVECGLCMARIDLTEYSW